MAGQRTSRVVPKSATGETMPVPDESDLRPIGEGAEAAGRAAANA